MSAPDGALPGWLVPLVDAVDGITFADLSRFAPPDDGYGREAAVLIAFSDPERPGGGPGVLLLERAATMRTHAGQAAFPGAPPIPVRNQPRRRYARRRRRSASTRRACT